MTSIPKRRWMLQFPISLFLEGPGCYERMVDVGVDTAMLCTVIYSPYRLLLPRYPDKGLYSLEEGRYYYLPDAARYKGLPIQPLPSLDFSGRDLLGEAVDGATKAGLKAAAWVTLFANGAIAKIHPAWAVHNLYGSPDRLFLCFNNPEVREYSLRVCEEIAERYALTEIMLDKIPQTCIEIEAFGGRLDPVLRTLASLCFCSHCSAAAERIGLDLRECRKKARALAAEIIAIPPHVINALADDLTGDTGIPLLLLDHSWVLDVLNFRIRSMLDFLEEARSRVEAKRPDIALSAAFLPLVKAGHDAANPRSWLAVQNYAAYKDSALDLIHSVVHWDADVVEYETRRAVQAVAGGKVGIATHIRAYGRTRPEELPGLVAAVARGGARGVGYFCYDLMSEALLSALRQIHV